MGEDGFSLSFPLSGSWKGFDSDRCVVFSAFPLRCLLVLIAHRSCRLSHLPRDLCVPLSSLSRNFELFFILNTFLPFQFSNNMLQFVYLQLPYVFILMHFYVYHRPFLSTLYTHSSRWRNVLSPFFPLYFPTQPNLHPPSAAEIKLSKSSCVVSLEQ